MWKYFALLILLFGIVLYALDSRHDLAMERAQLERAKLEAQAKELRTKKAPPAHSAPTDEELRQAAAKVFGDLQAPAPESPREIPVVVEPELRANALVVWQVTERNKFWHRVSYTVELWSMVPQTLLVDVEVNVLNGNGLPLDQSRHRSIVLPGDGRRMKVTDLKLVLCPACYEVSKVEAAMAIRSGS